MTAIVNVTGPYYPGKTASGTTDGACTCCGVNRIHYVLCPGETSVSGETNLYYEDDYFSTLYGLGTPPTSLQWGGNCWFLNGMVETLSLMNPTPDGIFTSCAYCEPPPLFTCPTDCTGCPDSVTLKLGAITQVVGLGEPDQVYGPGEYTLTKTTLTGTGVTHGDPPFDVRGCNWYYYIPVSDADAAVGRSTQRFHLFCSANGDGTFSWYLEVSFPFSGCQWSITGTISSCPPSGASWTFVGCPGGFTFSGGVSIGY